MENRLKERLTGAAILVALVVLIVPEMFRNQRHPAADKPAAAGEGPPLRSFTIELDSSASRAASPQSSSRDARPGAPAETEGAQLAAPAPGASAARSPAAAPAVTLGVQSASAPSVSAGASLPSLSLPSSHARPAPSEAHGASTLGRAEPDLAAGWAVQLGLFSKSENAQRLVRSAQGKGFVARVTRTGSKGLYRVAIAGLADRAAAEQLSRRLRADGFSAAILGPR